jgi:hypothetical protein
LLLEDGVSLPPSELRAIPNSIIACPSSGTDTPNFANNDGNVDNDEAIAAVVTVPFSDIDEEHAGLDFGDNHNWSEPTIFLTNEQLDKIDSWLDTEVVQKHKAEEEAAGLQLPSMHDGRTFELLDAKDDHRDILAYILAKVQ